MPAHGRVAHEEFPKTPIGDGFNHVPNANVGVAIAFPCECENRIRAGFDTSMDEPRKVHAEEWKFGIRNRVDEIADKVRAFRLQFVVFTAERNDSRGIEVASHVAEAIALQAAAVDDEITFEISGRGGNMP